MSEHAGQVVSVDPVPPGEVEDRLTSLATGVDTWLDAAVEEFDPFSGPTVHKRRIRSKAFTEVSMYLYVARTVDDEGPDRVHDLCERRANEEAYYAQLRREPHALPKVGYPLAYLASVDELDPDARRVLETVLEWPEATAAGQPPSRQLDFWHLCEMCGYEGGLDHAGLLEYGYTSRSLNPADIGQQETFGLTHELLYYHNLGCGSGAFADEPLAYEHPPVFVGAVLRYMIEGHVDLVAELVFCGALQRQVAPGFVRFALGWLLTHVEDGSLSFPTDETADLERLVGGDVGDWTGESHAWRCDYHPTIVLGMLARVLGDDWPSIRAASDCRDLSHGAESEDLLALGEVFASFADYKLQRGATQLRDLAGTPVAAAYDDVVQDAVRFLQRQRRPDGTYGAWLDERTMFADVAAADVDVAGADVDDHFDEELLAPLSERCEAAVAAHDSADSNGS